MLDKFNRRINYLRISVTDRCNLRCVYCMPVEGIQQLKHEDILTFNEIIEVLKYAVGIGINKIRITGGEPLVRKGIVDLISMIKKVKGVNDLSMTTNAILLDRFANELKLAGLQRLNISLDTVDPKKYAETTRGGNIYQVFKGIEHAKKLGFSPIKINCVVKENSLENDAKEVAKYCEKNHLYVRFIRQMNLSTGKFSVIEGGNGGDCSCCNRLRLTANGNLKPCLFSDISYNVRILGVKEAFNRVVDNKPQYGTFCKENQFFNIGG